MPFAILLGLPFAILLSLPFAILLRLPFACCGPLFDIFTQFFRLFAQFFLLVCNPVKAVYPFQCFLSSLPFQVCLTVNKAFKPFDLLVKACNRLVLVSQDITFILQCILFVDQLIESLFPLFKLLNLLLEAISFVFLLEQKFYEHPHVIHCFLLLFPGSIKSGQVQEVGNLVHTPFQQHLLRGLEGFHEFL